MELSLEEISILLSLSNKYQISFDLLISELKEKKLIIESNRKTLITNAIKDFTKWMEDNIDNDEFEFIDSNDELINAFMQQYKL
jgi:hypothetical protein